MPSVAAATRFFAVLALVCTAFVVGAGALRLAAAAGHGPARAAQARAAEALRGPATGLAAMVALVAMAGSLYYSEVAGFPPCRLCWLQRGAMYPLGPALAVAAATGWRTWRPPLRLLALAGAGVSTWHLLVERWPALEGAACDPANPCSVVWVRDLAVFSIPAMALAGFAAITVLLSLRPPGDPAHARPGGGPS